MLRQNYTETFRGSLDSILLNTKIVDQNGLNVTPCITRCSNTFKIKQMSSELKNFNKT